MIKTVSTFRHRLEKFKQDMKDIRPALISGAVCALIAVIVLISLGYAPAVAVCYSGVAFFGGYCFGGILFIDH